MQRRRRRRRAFAVPPQGKRRKRLPRQQAHRDARSQAGHRLPPRHAWARTRLLAPFLRRPPPSRAHQRRACASPPADTTAGAAESIKRSTLRRSAGSAGVRRGPRGNSASSHLTMSTLSTTVAPRSCTAGTRPRGLTEGRNQGGLEDRSTWTRSKGTSWGCKGGRLRLALTGSNLGLARGRGGPLLQRLPAAPANPGRAANGILAALRGSRPPLSSVGRQALGRRALKGHARMRHARPREPLYKPVPGAPCAGTPGAPCGRTGSRCGCTARRGRCWAGARAGCGRVGRSAWRGAFAAAAAAFR